MILGNVFNLKNGFEKNLGIWQNIGNTFKNLKNHLEYWKMTCNILYKNTC